MGRLFVILLESDFLPLFELKLEVVRKIFFKNTKKNMPQKIIILFLKIPN